MADCPSCGAPLTGKLCACGYAVRVSQQIKFSSRPQVEVDRAFREKLREVEAKVAEYKKTHKGCSTKEACFAISPIVKDVKSVSKVVGKKFKKSAEEDFEDAMLDYRAEQA
jgi:uncharacterized Zn finger protein (UPF0148 family)